jgi:hypothetical protein
VTATLFKKDRYPLHDLSHHKSFHFLLHSSEENLSRQILFKYLLVAPE